jgi:hypothetical protein
MALVYWFADGVGEKVTVGGPDGKTPIPTALIRWIRANGTPALIIYGGDVYPSGNTKSFTEFFKQMDSDVRLMCGPPGNHDWKDDPDMPGAGRIPHGYDTFWQNHPESKQPVNMTKKGGARYEHFIDLDGWRLLFVDTGDYDANPWPAGDPARVTWLQNNLRPGRSNILVAHHSRLSRGRHGDNDKLDTLWRTLFDASGTPKVAFTLAGHDHSVSVYGPRSMEDPKGHPVTPDKGIYVVVNGAGGDGHYSQQGVFGLGVSGTKPDIFSDDEHFCVTRINLIDSKSADVDVLDFGTSAKNGPESIAKSVVKVRL